MPRLTQGLLLLAVVLGATVGLSACAPETGLKQPLTKSEVEAAKDSLPEVYDSECYASYESSALANCVLTNDDSDFDVYLVGDSHAAQWTSAIEQIAAEHDWRLTFYGKRSCTFSENEHTDNSGSTYPSCDAWNEKVQREILTNKPDVVITANYGRHIVMEHGNILERGANTQGEAVLADGMRDAWKPVIDAGIELVVLQDTPYMEHNVPDCLMENLKRPASCNVTYSEAVEHRPHPELIAAQSLPEAHVIDPTDSLCPNRKVCVAVEGGMIVWRDAHHLSASYSATMQDELQRDLSEVPELSREL